jgi:HTH-type transcriptional regulator, sugar sensing transcriptional regulator
MIPECVLSALQKLGLTYYEAKVYYALIMLGSAKPSQIAEESGIPRTKIYDILRKLEKKKWINIENSRPANITPRHPKEILEKQKLSFNSKIDRVSKILTMLYDNVITYETLNTKIAYSKKSIISLVEKVIKTAKNRIMLMGSLYLPQEIEFLKDQMFQAKERDISVKIIADPKDKTILDKLNESFDVKRGHPYCMKIIIVDNKEILFMIAKIKDGTPDINDITAIWVTNPLFTPYLSSFFEMEWKNLEYYTDYE